MRFRNDPTASTPSVAVIICSGADLGAFRKKKITIAWPVRYWLSPKRMKKMAKSSLADRMMRSALKVVRATENKIGRSYLGLADVELRACFGIYPMEWEARVYIGQFKFEERDVDPIKVLTKLESSILNKDFTGILIRW